MFAMSRSRLMVFAGIVGLTFAAFLAFAAFSSTAEATHSWGTYHWARTLNPFPLKVGDNVNSAWDSYLKNTTWDNTSGGSDWADSTMVKPTRVDDGTTSNLRKCYPTSGRVEVCNYSYGRNGWLGLATIWASGSHITQGTAKMNDSYFSTSTYNTPGWRNLVMCQEVGHTFGLSHINETYDTPNEGSCMDYTRDPDGPPTNEWPGSHDYQQLETIYNNLNHYNGGPTDGTSTVKMPPALGQIDFNNPANWGRLIQKSRDGRIEKYQRDFGNGYRVFNFVIRAE